MVGGLILAYVDRHLVPATMTNWDRCLRGRGEHGHPGDGFHPCFPAAAERAVDQRFNRARYDADQMVAAFAARLKDAVDLDAVQADLASVVQQALEPAHVSMWRNNRG